MGDFFSDLSEIKHLTRKKFRRRVNRTAALFLGTCAIVLQTGFEAPAKGQVRIDNTVLFFETVEALKTDRPFKIEQLAIVIFATSGTTFNVPSDWDSANNFVDCIGPGSRGVAPSAGVKGGDGGGAGAWARKNNVSLSAGGTCPMVIGSGNSGTNTSFNSGSCVAQAATANSRTGGTAASSTGDSKNNGGTGGLGESFGLFACGGGGAGAGGPNGAGGGGANGGDAGGGQGSGGGAGNAGLSGGGSGAGTPGIGNNGGNGGSGTTYTQTSPSISAGPGGGGAGAGHAASVLTGGNAGNYGAGAGAGNDQGSNGNAADGLIVATYTPAAGDRVPYQPNYQRASIMAQ
jgi:hypothetical protein